MSLTNLFETDAGAYKLSDDQVSGIAGLAKRAKMLEKEIAEMEETLSERNEQYRKLTEQTLPEAMAETVPAFQRHARQKRTNGYATMVLTTLSRTPSASALGAMKTSFPPVY